MSSETDQRIDVALVGATGYAGQELVRILARHPRIRLTAALGSASMEAPRKLPALARIWDGEVLPYAPERIAPSVKAAFLALPEANAAETAPGSAGARHPRHRPVGRLPPARRRGPRQALSEDGDAAGRHRVRPGRAGSRRPRLRAAHLVPGLLSDRRAHRTGAARSRRAARRRRHRRRQVGRLGRRQGADRAHALLREPRQRRGLRPVLAPPHARDRAGAGRPAGDVRAAPGAARPRHPRDDLRPREEGHHQRGHRRALRRRLQGRRLRARHRRPAAGDQARRAHQLLRHRLEAG